MAEDVLFITRNDLVRFTSTNGNVDPDKFFQMIKIAQDLHIQGYLGTKLFDRLKDDIKNSTLVDPYKTLLDDYVKPMTIHYAMIEYLPFASYEIGNKGIYKRTSETGETVAKDEVDSLIEKYRDLAQHYTQRFIDYICFRTSDFPEYNTNSNGDVYPTTKNDFGGWHL